DQCCGKLRRLICMLGLTFSFFVVEMVVSHVTESLAMLSDAFHMLSDVLALSVGLVAVLVSARSGPSQRNTFGWVRAEVLGAVVNAVFLVALCLSISLEAVQRLVAPRPVEHPLLVVIVGAAGLLINLVGLCLFQGQGHGHDGLGQGEHPYGKSHLFITYVGSQMGDEVDKTNMDVVMVRYEEREEGEGQKEGEEHLWSMDGAKGNSTMNMQAVFLHVMGDALGSLAVIINALVYMHFRRTCRHGDTCWVLYLDPLLSLAIVAILLSTALPLLRKAALVLLQAVPKHVSVDSLRKDLAALPGVSAVHELHVWELSGPLLVATAHVAVHPGQGANLSTVVHEACSVLRSKGICFRTVQPEWEHAPVPAVDGHDKRSSPLITTPLICQPINHHSTHLPAEKPPLHSSASRETTTPLICQPRNHHSTHLPAHKPPLHSSASP
uniref:Solute carrier family 30 member 1 n=1 Tax=Eptatretus burgeri TaxID=7764 RepID=A0A8C4QLG5_EPTBU